MISKLIISYKLLDNEHLFRLEYDSIVKDIKTADFDIESKTDGNHYTINLIAHKGIRLADARLIIDHKYHENDSYFLNGFQTWTDSLEYPYDYELRDVRNISAPLLKRFAFDKYGETDFYKYQKYVFHAFDISYLYGIDPVFIGSLNYKNAYLIIEHYKHGNKLILRSDVDGKELNEGEVFSLYDYIMDREVDKVREEYLAYFKPLEAKKMFSYSTWYDYYQNINDKALDELLSGIDQTKYHYDLFQIDDGYEEHVGDWQKVDKQKFPDGLKKYVDLIHKKGMLAGIWLSPFVAEKNSEVYKNHYDWLKKDENSNPYLCGGNWSGFYALDLDNEEVLNYIKECLNFFVEQGFDYFKLDFLYATNKGLYKGETRASKTRKMYEFIRSILQDKLIMGCGANLVQAAGVYNYMRVGCDVSLIFDDVFYMKLFHRERISTKRCILDTIYRSFMNNHLFLNDPDVFILRKNNNSLSDKQKESLIMINAIFASSMQTSDNIAKYDSEQLALLDKCLDIYYHAEGAKFKKLNKREMEIMYTLHDKEYKYLYNGDTGVLELLNE